MSKIPKVEVPGSSSSSITVSNNLESNRGLTHVYDDLGPDELKKIYSVDAADVVTLKIVFSVDDLDKESSTYAFKPQLVHQVFGFSDCLFGYKDPKINIYLAANSCKGYFTFTYSEEIPAGLQYPDPDDFMPKLKLWLPENCTQVKDKFVKVVKREDHTKVYGQIFHTFEHRNAEDKTSKFVVTECGISEPGFVEFHERFQCYFVWFIDAASQIDTTDPNWMYIYLYEEKKLDNGKYGRYPIGCCTFYKFYNYPDNIRTRISQMLILPPWQRLGLGTKLLEAMYKLTKTLPNVVDITVEDPCPEFAKMRDLLDCKLLGTLESFKYPKIMQGFTKEMYTEANDLIKTNKRQCRRIYEILCLSQCRNEEDAAKLYAEIKRHFTTPYKRLMSKKRLGAHFQKEKEKELLAEYNDDIKLQMSTYLSNLNEIANRLISNNED